MSVTYQVRRTRCSGPAPAAAADAYLIASRFQMVEHRRDRQRVFAGACRHRLERHDGHFRIRWKRVDLVNCDGMMEGLAVPF